MTVSLKDGFFKTIANTFIKIRKVTQVIRKIVAALYYGHIEPNKQHGFKYT